MMCVTDNTGKQRCVHSSPPRPEFLAECRAVYLAGASYVPIGAPELPLSVGWMDLEQY